VCGVRVWCVCVCGVCGVCVCVVVSLGTQHAMRIGHIVICDLSGSTIFFHMIPQMAQFSGEEGKY